MEGASERDALEAETKAAQLPEILDSTLKVANDPDQIRREAATPEAEYKKRREDALKRVREL